MHNDKKTQQSQLEKQVEKNNLYLKLTSRKSKDATDQLFAASENELADTFQKENDDDK